jgi:hypothetical protein
MKFLWCRGLYTRGRAALWQLGSARMFAGGTTRLMMNAFKAAALKA